MSMPAESSKDDDWREQAACRTTNGRLASLFYPTETKGVPPAAALLCQRCPVEDVCRAYALSHEVFGVWAGMSEDDRFNLRKRAGIEVTVPHFRHHRRRSFEGTS